MRAGRLADDIPELAELHLNPVIATSTGSVVLDVKLRLAPVLPRSEPWLRRLR